MSPFKVILVIGQHILRANIPRQRQQLQSGSTKYAFKALSASEQCPTSSYRLRNLQNLLYSTHNNRQQSYSADLPLEAVQGGL